MRPRSPEHQRHSPRRPRRASAWLAGLVSIAGHAALVLALLSARVEPMAPEPEAITVALTPPDPPPPLPPAPEAAAPSKTPDLAPTRPRARSIPRPTVKPPPDVEPPPASKIAAREPSVLLGDGDLVGATTAGSGSGGGGGAGAGGGGRCDMVRLLEAALRKNPRVLAALARAHPDAAGRAVMVWNGDWIQNAAQSGKGLAGIREAIILEVGFAPAACRADPMRGLVVISLTDTPGASRLVLGTGAWRWSDLLFAR